MNDEDKKKVKATPQDDLIKYHHSWGMWIRNEFGMWKGNHTLVRSCASMRQNEELHPDSASGIIIEEVWKKLQND